MELSQFVQSVMNGLAIGSVYAIFALGYTLVFSILGIINFAHGAVFTLGAYFTYTLVVGQFENNGLLKGINLFPDGSPFAGNPWMFALATLLAALEARGGKKGLASLCIGGGEAVAMAVERV